MDYDYDGYDQDVPNEGEPLYHDDEDVNPTRNPGMSLDELIYFCLGPTIHQTIVSISQVLFWAFIFRFSQVLNINVRYKHFLSFIFGILSLHSLFPNTFAALLFLPALSYLVLYFPTRRGVKMLILSGILLVSYEFFLLDSRLWNQIRGPQMIIAMKVVSIAFDLDIGRAKDIPNVLQYAGYVLCPGNCVFGPWTNYHDYLNLYVPRPFRPAWIRKIIHTAYLALCFLSLSICGVHFVFQENHWKWITAYRDALSYRCSHYFVSYLSQLTLVVAGFTRTGLGEEMSVSKPCSVEFPRSIIQVVISWNTPMHTWLKVYIFLTTKSQMGNFIAILTTYAVSALLHGLNFQLAAVLISLGFFSYIEFVLRKKLASIFSACISAKPCRADCGHRNLWNEPTVIVVNVIFSLLTIFHLAYLGVMFDQSEKSESGYSAEHTLSKWAELDYLSHIVALFTYLMFYLI